jgi:hypothetical protein
VKDKRERWVEITDLAADEHVLDNYTDPVREIDGLIAGKQDQFAQPEYHPNLLNNDLRQIPVPVCSILNRRSVASSLTLITSILDLFKNSASSGR